MRSDALYEKFVTARIEHRADTRERRADLRILGDVNHIAREREAEPDAEACAVNRGKRGRGKIRQPPNHRIENLLKNRLCILVPGVRIREIAPGAKSGTLA